MNKELVLFDNTNYSERFNETREFLFNQYAEENDWESQDDVPDDMIQDEMSFQEEIDYHYFKDKFTQLLKAGYCLLVGTCGRWNGPAKGGKFITDFRDLSSAIQHLDYLKITDKNGHLYVEGYHHDGSDSYEIKQLTRKGFAYANNNCFAHSQKLHEKIMNNNFLSRLPHLADI